MATQGRGTVSYPGSTPGWAYSFFVMRGVPFFPHERSDIRDNKVPWVARIERSDIRDRQTRVSLTLNPGYAAA
jgi:hypothetical protein